MRVIGSHAMSTRDSVPWPAARCGCVTVMGSASLVGSPGALRAGGQFAAALTPLGLAVERVSRDLAEAAHRVAVGRDRGRGELAAGRLVHERHELVGEAGHRAADADAADVGATADAVHPAALGDVALDRRAPAAE